jgi:hypothetical protein
MNEFTWKAFSTLKGEEQRNVERDSTMPQQLELRER